MTFQSTEPLRPMNLQIFARNLMAFEVDAASGRDDFDLSPPYQRGSVWTYGQRVELIRSFMTGTPVPAIIVNYRLNAAWTRRNGEYDPALPAYAVIDGKQRVETIRRWFAGDLEAPASWFKSDAVRSTISTADGLYVNYHGLTELGQRKARMSWTIPTAEASVASVSEEAQVYLRVNGAGTPQSELDMSNAQDVAGR